MHDYGFHYLNSEYSNKQLSKLDAEISLTLKTINEPNLNSIYESWKKHQALRDIEMINRIYDFCNDNTFEKAVFIVGVAHKESIIEKSKDMQIYSEKFEWDINWQQEYSIQQRYA